MNLDYSLKTPQERVECVNQLLSELPADSFNTRYLNYMSDYILFVSDKNSTKNEKKKEHPIVTKNREVTVNKRQVSFEEVISNLENGEDGLYSMITNDKNQIMDHKEKVTDKDVDEVPGLKENLELIKTLKRQFDAATGSTRFSLKKQIIETWQQIYILKASAKGNPVRMKNTSQLKNMAHVPIKENIWLDEDDMPHSDGMVTLFNPAHVSFLLTYYSQLKQESWDDLDSDMHYLLLTLEDVATRALENSSVLWDLLIWKVDGDTNEDICAKMESQYGIVHNGQYFSTLWKKKIPKLIAEQAQKDYVIWYFTNIEYGQWKKCGKCGEIKLAHPLFFSHNTSKDHYYSICKECRRKKNLGDN